MFSGINNDLCSVMKQQFLFNNISRNMLICGYFFLNNF